MSPPKFRRKIKVVREALEDVDYWSKLSLEEREWLEQFNYEYYGADFNFDKPIHGPSKYKDCRDRNNASKRQVHSVGSNLIKESEVRAIKDNLKKTGSVVRYTPQDYGNFSEISPFEDEDDENN